MALQEVHYCCLMSQSNIYGLSKFVTPSGIHKVLVTSLRGRVLSLEFQKTTPLSRDVHFTYIPGDAEVVSMDAFNKHHYGSGVTVGITFIKPGEGKSCQYLNIYSELEPGAEYDLDRIAQGCQNLELSFIPYQLYHTELTILPDSSEMVFLLSGNDQRVHLYREDKNCHTFSEENSDAFFPEFADLQSNVLCLECKLMEFLQRRISVAGCLDGTVLVALVDTNKCEVIARWSTQHDSAITSIQFYSLYNQVECPSFITQVMDAFDDSLDVEQSEVHLLVNSALEAAVVYRSVLERGLTDGMVLPGSEQYDSVICGLVADIDFDGQSEILLGTYGQELLVYKFRPKRRSARRETRPVDMDTLDRRRSSLNKLSEQNRAVATLKAAKSLPALGSETQDMTSSCSELLSPSQLDASNDDDHNANTSSSRDADSSDDVTADISSCDVSTDVSENTVTSGGPPGGLGLQDGEFVLHWQRSFADPVLALDWLDILGDGLREVIVVSLKGLHVLQHDLTAVAALCTERMKQLAELQNRQEDVFKQLLSEALT